MIHAHVEVEKNIKIVMAVMINKKFIFSFARQNSANADFHSYLRKKYTH